MPIAVGSAAPDFSLKQKTASGLVDVKLADNLGKKNTVILFFPLAFSPVCTEEFCTFRDNWAKWAELGCDVYGISVDSPFVVKKFRELENIPFPILSDFNKTVSRAYGALHRDLFRPLTFFLHHRHCRPSFAAELPRFSAGCLLICVRLPPQSGCQAPKLQPA